MKKKKVTKKKATKKKIKEKEIKSGKPAIKYKYHNSAGRLLAILELANISGPRAKNIHVWSKVSGLSVDQRVQIYGFLVKLSELLDDTETRILAMDLPSARTNYVQNTFAALKDVLLSCNLNGYWGSSKKRIDQATLAFLEFCAFSLGEDGTISEDELAEIYTSIGDVFKQVSDSNLNKDLKALLLRLLVSIKSAIDDYWIGGVDGIRHSCSAIIVEIKRHQDLLKSHSTQPWMKKLFNMVVKLDGIVAKAIKYRKLLEYVVPKLDSK